MKFLNCEDCKKLFKNEELFVFGAGVDGEKLYSKLADTVCIGAFIDNKRFGENNFLCGKEIISLEQFRQRRTHNQPIIVASYRFMADICNQLEEEG